MYDWAWGPVKTVLTIHNIGYGHQGQFDKAAMPGVGLSWDLFTMHRLEHYDHVNFLKGGIVYSDAVTTVSRRYAEEIKTPEFGAGSDFPRAARHVSRPGRRAHRVQRLAGAQDRGGRGHVPDAVALRAVRPESDVLVEIRDSSDCPRHRRLGRHGGSRSRLQVCASR